jgi:putative membrane protein
MRKEIYFTLAMVGVFLCSCHDNEPDGFNAIDQGFIREAMNVNMGEIGLGSLALTNAQSEQVKNFGRTIVTDHQTALDELRTIAENEGIRMPAAPVDKYEQKRLQLLKVTNYSFDTLYMRMQVLDHRKTMALFKKQISNGEEREVVDYARRYLPYIQMHFQKADSIYSAIRTQGSSD